VWVINGEPAKVRWRPVTVEQLDAERARVSGNLHQGDRIVALGAHLLRDGVQVRVAAAEGAAVSPGRFNLSALAVRERAVTLFLIVLISLAGILAFFKLGRAEDPPSRSR
jgi:hypothetical protein